jgi:hypothetical protein
MSLVGYLFQVRLRSFWLVLGVVACGGSDANLGIPTGDSGGSSCSDGDGARGDGARTESGPGDDGSANDGSPDDSSSNMDGSGSGSGGDATSDGSGSGSDASDGGIVDSAPDTTSYCTIAFRDSTTAYSYTAVTNLPTTITLGRPSGALGRDLLLAYIYGGDSAGTAAPIITAPVGWSLVRRTDYGYIGTMAVYSHIVGSGEPISYSWSINQAFLYASWILAYGGVDTVQPIDNDAQQSSGASGTLFSTTMLTTSGPNEMVLAGFAGYAGPAAIAAPQWTPPSGMTNRVNFNNMVARAGAASDHLFASAGAVGPFSATSSVTDDFAITDILAIRPCH